MLDTPTDAPESPPNRQEWLSVGDFAAARRLSVRTVKRYIEAGEVETKKESGRRFVRDFEKGQTGHLERDTAKGTEGTRRDRRDRRDTKGQKGHEGTEGTRRDTKGHEGEDMSLPVSLHAQSEGQKGQGESVRSATLEETEGTNIVSLLALSSEGEAGEVKASSRSGTRAGRRGLPSRRD